MTPPKFVPQYDGRDKVNSYVYLQSEPGLWTVGYFKFNGTWYSESDHGSENAAAARVAWLNGSAASGAGPQPVTPTDRPNISTKEHWVLMHLAQAWNGYVQLDARDDDDDKEFHAAIHAAQAVLALRVARRVDPDTWTPATRRGRG